MEQAGELSKVFPWGGRPLSWGCGRGAAPERAKHAAQEGTFPCARINNVREGGVLLRWIRRAGGQIGEGRPPRSRDPTKQRQIIYKRKRARWDSPWDWESSTSILAVGWYTDIWLRMVAPSLVITTDPSPF